MAIFSKKTPKFTIGRLVGQASPVVVAPTGVSSVQLSAMERIGDSVGSAIWKSIPAAKAIGRGTLAVAKEFGGVPYDTPLRPCPYTDMNHPDHPMWDKHFGRK